MHQQKLCLLPGPALSRVFLGTKRKLHANKTKGPQPMRSSQLDHVDTSARVTNP